MFNIGDEVTLKVRTSGMLSGKIVADLTGAIEDVSTLNMMYLVRHNNHDVDPEGARWFREEILKLAVLNKQRSDV